MIRNFGRNLTIDPARFCCPRTEAELLHFLDDNRCSNIRVIGRLHSWSQVLQAHDAVIDMRHFDSVELDRSGEEWAVRVGAGCQIKKVLESLQSHGLTLPTLGLIDEQSVAGAIATGTHGSGRQSLSHFVRAIRIASFSGDQRNAKVDWIQANESPRLRAARCSLGCLGVVTEIELPVRKQYSIEEHLQRYETLEEVIAQEADYPLQQFYFVPWKWDYFAQHRVETDQKRSWHASLYRWFWALGMDTIFHVIVCLLARWLPRRCTAFAYQKLIPQLIPRNWKVVDRSDRQLTMQHERFRHIEVELFVPGKHLKGSLHAARELLMSYAAKPGLENYTHHYPICVRRVLQDDTLISPASGGNEPWYTLSFISYARPAERESFEAFATELVQTMGEQFAARPHWGKFCPLTFDSVNHLYPQWDDFAAIVQMNGAGDSFANAWLQGLLNQTQS
ncbi:D-arabinono-1,4-lactone oxidase [Rhodopirellula europaea]|uniref:FAD-dependent oxidoreductase n=1 Tax=Rhodopirellula europaea 6C TaxID=1263867 RepID=M2A4W5_9BACT|nr:D-arabinono-1,4-lactone oxidase [Rhodopirellula europaea]EMB14911.1 FAD-dependent oxidoreductase [Rhodopirellula europaea 6C]